MAGMAHVPVRAIWVSRMYTYALLSIGEADCRGNNYRGQLGDGGTAISQTTPVAGEVPSSRESCCQNGKTPLHGVLPFAKEGLTAPLVPGRRALLIRAS